MVDAFVKVIWQKKKVISFIVSILVMVDAFVKVINMQSLTYPYVSILVMVDAFVKVPTFST